jgi:hypothetical protein
MNVGGVCLNPAENARVVPVKILELKRHLNKPDESYWCDLLQRGQDWIVIKYISDRPGRVGGVAFDAGSTTFAYYRTGMGYVVWKMLNPQQGLVGHLFHICRDLQVQSDRVEYLDLLLDIWVDPVGRMTILDRDELHAGVSNGVVSQQDLDWIARHQQEITENWRQIIADFDRLL